MDCGGDFDSESVPEEALVEGHCPHHDTSEPADMCIDMCIDMCMNKCMERCMDMCIDI